MSASSARPTSRASRGRIVRMHRHTSEPSSADPALAPHQNVCPRCARPLYEPPQTVQRRRVVSCEPEVRRRTALRPANQFRESLLSRACHDVTAPARTLGELPPRYGLLVGRSISGQSTLVIVHNGQCRSLPIDSSAGSHIAACQPPASARRRRPAFTDTHSGCENPARTATSHRSRLRLRNRSEGGCENRWNGPPFGRLRDRG